MRITIESTDEVTAHGRIWRGTTGTGVPCLVFVSYLGSETEADRAALEPELATLVILQQLRELPTEQRVDVLAAVAKAITA